MSEAGPFTGPFTVRLMEIDEAPISLDGLIGLIGQVPNLSGVPGSPIARVIDAKVEDGWVVVTLEPLP